MTTFNVYRRESNDSNPPVAIATGLTSMAYSDDTAEVGKTYLYCVGAAKSGFEKISDEISVFAGGDPHWENVTILINFENGYQNLSSKPNNTATAVRNFSLNTTNQKFGTGCGAFNVGTTNSGSIELPPSLFQPSTGDWTVECWLNPVDYNRAYDLSIFGFKQSGLEVSMYITRYGGMPSWWDGSNYFTSNISIPQNVWSHVAWCRKDGALLCFVQGTKTILNTNYTRSLSATSKLILGGSYNDTYNNMYVGYIDEFRVTVGECRYTENFTPTTTPFPTT